MKYIPILFNTEMVQAILAGKKTQTRRVAKYSAQRVYDFACADGKWYENYDPKNPPRHLVEWYLRMGTVGPCMNGDILWVRETWSTHYDGIHADLAYCYKADGINLKAECAPGETNRWYPSIHMPREAARLFLKVKDVRLERLRDGFFKAGATILEVSKEGVNIGETCRGCIEHYGQPCCVDTDGCTECVELDNSRYAFSKIWDNTITPDKLGCFGWPANPWVWVITFERCDKPKGW